MIIVLWILIAILAAELAGGIFHWWEDRYGNPDWPILGERIVKPNIEHHQFPTKFCKQSYWKRNYDLIIICGLLAIPFYWCWQMLVFLLFTSQMNEFHALTHRKNNKFIKLLQDWQILQTHYHHKLHHTRPYDQNYCVMTNILNPILYKIKFWQGLECLVYLTCGAKPRLDREIY